MRESHSPVVIWYYEIQSRSLIHNAVHHSLFQDQGKTHYECTFGYQSYISNVYNFGWSEWVFYRDFGSFPENKEKLGKILGPCNNEGNQTSQCSVASSGHVITRQTV